MDAEIALPNLRRPLAMMERIGRVAEDIVTRYVAVLDAVARSGRIKALDEDVDILWHLHILDLKDYLAFCRERYGRVILHDLPDVPKALTANLAPAGEHREIERALRTACITALQCSGPEGD